MSSASASSRRRVLATSIMGAPSSARDGVERRQIAALERRFRLQAREIPADGHDRERPSVRHEAGRAAALRRISVEHDVVPPLGVPDILERYVVVIAPEERHGLEAFVLAEDVSRRGLPLRSEEHTSELQSLAYLVCRLL